MQRAPRFAHFSRSFSTNARTRACFCPARFNRRFFRAAAAFNRPHFTRASASLLFSFFSLFPSPLPWFVHERTRARLTAERTERRPKRERRWSKVKYFKARRWNYLTDVGYRGSEQQSRESRPMGTCPSRFARILCTWTFVTSSTYKTLRVQ